MINFRTARADWAPRDKPSAPLKNRGASRLRRSEIFGDGILSDPDYLAFDGTICEVIVMSGLPGAGKDHWIATSGPDWPVSSLDELRREMKIAPAENQGPVVAQAGESARQYLRLKQSFIWNATNISRQLREHCISLCAAYNARVRIIYIETGAAALAERNRSRERGVPPKVINRFLARWEPPDLTKAHQVEVIVR